MRHQQPSAYYGGPRGMHGGLVLPMLGVIVILTCGCGIPKLACAPSGPPLPADYNGATTPDNSARIGIVEFFDEPMLTQLIFEGLAQNQELRIRNQEVVIARNEVMARRGAILPFVELGALGGFERTSKFTPLGAAEDQLTFPGGGEFPDPLPNTRLSANLVWQIDIWRQLRNARDAAIQRYYAAIDARNYFITQLVAEIAENYYELAALDKRLEYLNQTIDLQSHSLEVARSQKAAARGTELGVQRFLAEVRKNESQRRIIEQRILEVGNRINLLVGRYPQPIDRADWDYINLDSRAVRIGVPADLLLNRGDVRAAERELAAAGLDVLVARAYFYPRLTISAGVGFEAFNPRYLFDPGAFIASTAGEIVAPLVNRSAIRADFLSANARQVQAMYDYQRTLLNAYVEVVNRVNKAENYRQSVAIKRQEVKALEESVGIATDLFQAARREVEYIDVLFAQRDLLEARIVLIETKQQQLSAIVNAYQALGGGLLQSTPMTLEQLSGPPLLLEPEEAASPQPPGEILPAPPPQP